MTCRENKTCEIILSATIGPAENVTQSLNISRTLTTIEISLILTLGMVTTLCNLIVLLASKFASGGQSPTLVFIRSLCVGDVLLGFYGISKMLMFLNLDILLINFFLPESFFFTASIASLLSLLALNIDCSLKLSKPLQYLQHMDKKNIITVMVLLWNVSFIIGFLPQIGWNDQDYILSFFFYYPWHYLFFHGVLIFIIIVLNFVVILFLRYKTTQIVTNNTFMGGRSQEFQKYRRLVVTTIIDLGLWFVCCVPFYTYLGLFCRVCPLADLPGSDINIVYFIPVFLIKSFVSAIVHGYRTAQIKSVIQTLSRGVSRMVNNSRKNRRRNGISAISNNSARSSNQSDEDVAFNEPITRIGSVYSNNTFIGGSQTTIMTVFSDGLVATKDEITVL